MNGLTIIVTRDEIFNLGIGGGDYINFSYDTKTGQILNWSPLKDKDVLQIIEDKE